MLSSFAINILFAFRYSKSLKLFNALYKRSYDVCMPRLHIKYANAINNCKFFDNGMLKVDFDEPSLDLTSAFACTKRALCR